MDLPLLHFNQFIQKKVGNQLTANLNIDLVFLSLVYSSTHKGRTGKSYTSVVHGLHTSQLLLCPTEIALSVSAGSFIALISQNNSAGSRKK